MYKEKSYYVVKIIADIIVKYKVGFSALIPLNHERGILKIFHVDLHILLI